MLFIDLKLPFLEMVFHPPFLSYFLLFLLLHVGDNTLVVIDFEVFQCLNSWFSIYCASKRDFLSKEISCNYRVCPRKDGPEALEYSSALWLLCGIVTVRGNYSLGPLHHKINTTGQPSLTHVRRGAETPETQL